MVLSKIGFVVGIISVLVFGAATAFLSRAFQEVSHQPSHYARAGDPI